MFTDIFLQTTDPNLTMTQLFRSQILLQILFSIVFHIIIYVFFFNLASFIFLGKILSNVVNQRLICFLFIIMTVGYFSRIYHVKEIHRAYTGDNVKTREHTNQLFISWVFIG